MMLLWTGFDHPVINNIADSIVNTSLDPGNAANTSIDTFVTIVESSATVESEFGAGEVCAK